MVAFQNHPLLLDQFQSGIAYPQNVNPDSYVVVMLITAIISLAGALAYVYKDSKKREVIMLTQFQTMNSEWQELSRQQIKASEELKASVQLNNNLLQSLSQLINLELHKR